MDKTITHWVNYMDLLTVTVGLVLCVLTTFLPPCHRPLLVKPLTPIILLTTPHDKNV